jgi:hypothetical protein
MRIGLTVPQLGELADPTAIKTVAIGAKPPATTRCGPSTGSWPPSSHAAPTRGPPTVPCPPNSTPC